MVMDFTEDANSKPIDWCKEHEHFSCAICQDVDSESISWQLAASQALPNKNVVKLMMSFLTRCSKSAEDVTSADMLNFISSVSKRNSALKTASCEGLSYGEVMASLMSFLIDKEIEEVRAIYSEASTARLEKLCANIFYLLSGDVNLIPEVLLGNLDDITDDHIRLAVMIVNKLSSLSPTWSQVGFTKYMVLCMHTREHIRRIGGKKSHILKLVLASQAPPGYIKFIRELSDDIYHLLSVNQSKIGWVLYTECEINDLLDVINLASAKAKESSSSEPNDEEIPEEEKEEEEAQENGEGMEVEETEETADDPMADMFMIDRGSPGEVAPSSGEDEAAEEDISSSNPAYNFNKAGSKPVKQSKQKKKKGRDNSEETQELGSIVPKDPGVEESKSAKKKKQKKNKKVKMSISDLGEDEDVSPQNFQIEEAEGAEEDENPVTLVVESSPGNHDEEVDQLVGSDETGVDGDVQSNTMLNDGEKDEPRGTAQRMWGSFSDDENSQNDSNSFVKTEPLSPEKKAERSRRQQKPVGKPKFYELEDENTSNDSALEDQPTNEGAAGENMRSADSKLASPAPALSIATPCSNQLTADDSPPRKLASLDSPKNKSSKHKSPIKDSPKVTHSSPAKSPKATHSSPASASGSKSPKKQRARSKKPLEEPAESANVAEIEMMPEPAPQALPASPQPNIVYRKTIDEVNRPGNAADHELIDISESHETSRRSSPVVVNLADIQDKIKDSLKSPSNPEICVIEINSRSEDALSSNRSPLASPDQLIPKSGGTTPTASGRTLNSGGRAPKSQVQETRHGLREERVLEKAVSEYLTKQSSPSKHPADTALPSGENYASLTENQEVELPSSYDPLTDLELGLSNSDSPVKQKSVSVSPVRRTRTRKSALPSTSTKTAAEPSDDEEASVSKRLPRVDKSATKVSEASNEKSSNAETPGRKRPSRSKKSLQVIETPAEKVENIETPAGKRSKGKISMQTPADKVETPAGKRSRGKISTQIPAEQVENVETPASKRSKGKISTQTPAEQVDNVETSTGKRSRETKSTPAAETSSKLSDSEEPPVGKRQPRSRKLLQTNETPATGSDSGEQPASKRPSRGKKLTQIAETPADVSDSDPPTTGKPSRSRKSAQITELATKRGKFTKLTTPEEQLGSDDSLCQDSVGSVRRSVRKRATVNLSMKLPDITEDKPEDSGPSSVAYLSTEALLTLPKVDKRRTRHDSGESNTTNNSTYSLRARKSVPAPTSVTPVVPDVKRATPRRQSVSSTESRTLRKRTK